MSGLQIGFKGQTLDSSGTDDGWKWIRSATHTTYYWTSHNAEGRYVAGGWRPTVTIKRKAWWRLLVVGVALPGNGVTLTLGPVLVEWSRRYVERPKAH